MSFRARRAGGAEIRSAGYAALAALRAGPARVFAAFERSCYVETPAGIACLGGPGLGLGPLNAIVERFAAPVVGDAVAINLDGVLPWKPGAPSGTGKIPDGEIPESILEAARMFLDWIAGTGTPDDALIGLGPGLTPAGDDFVGGAMIALRTFGYVDTAERIAAWALPLAGERTNRISRAHLECAAAGEGHEALHDYLGSFGPTALERLARIGHSSGLDAAAGARAALRAAQAADRLRRMKASRPRPASISA
jgi:hypothetical protein